MRAASIAARPAPRPLRLWPLGLAVALLAALWLGPLPEMARRAFSPHMILHLGVAGVAAPLLALGLLRLGRWKPGSVVAPALLASGLEMAVVWGWHAPALHEAAALNDLAFVGQQASFLAAGAAVWLASVAGRSRAAAGVGAVAMLFTFMHMAMLGMLLTLAPRLLYPPELCLGAFGLDPLDDQRLGGALMAVGGGLPYLAGGVFLAWRCLRDPRSSV